MTDSGFWTVFLFSFVVALTGAMSPGPLLTYTIIRSANDARGYLMGAWIIAGHALLESAVILLLLLGFSTLIRHPVAVRVIGVTGGTLLVLFGASILRDVFTGRIRTDFLDPPGNPPPKDATSIRGMNNPVVGGVLVSMANPYWWIWWATIGLSFMVQFNISFRNWPGLIAFFLGHEAGDLIWYAIISCLAFFGLRRLNPTAYKTILALCGLFMIGFGLYLGVLPWMNGA